ncbi:MAG: hypothetical protein H0Z24_06690 [Thermosipho sp. (in: Bacteria)]|nr:hypothetical protein [Thermosipho sp. (in: thermotogales)]
MNKKIYEKVKERANGRCENCFRYIGEKGELHHILGGRGKRQIYEREETCIMLCKNCHDHKNQDLIKKLKLKLQSYYFQQGYTEDEVRELMGGRLYLNDKGEIERGEVAHWLVGETLKQKMMLEDTLEVEV